MKKRQWKEMSQVLFDFILQSQWELWMQGDTTGVNEEEILEEYEVDDNLTEAEADEIQKQAIGELNQVTSVYMLTRDTFEAFIIAALKKIDNNPNQDGRDEWYTDMMTEWNTVSQLSYLKRKDVRKEMKKEQKKRAKEPIAHAALSRQPSNPNEEPFNDDTPDEPLDQRPIIGEDD